MTAKPVSMVSKPIPIGTRFSMWVTTSEIYSVMQSNRLRWKILMTCDCGTSKIVDVYTLLSGQSQSCGCLKALMTSLRRWNGGVTHNHGYKQITDPEHHRANSDGYVLEHIVVMEKMIGRPLVDGETVHHKNGVRDDNAETNLELWSTSQPAGQRVVDKLQWAHEIIALYEPLEGVL